MLGAPPLTEHHAIFIIADFGRDPISLDDPRLAVLPVLSPGSHLGTIGSATALETSIQMTTTSLRDVTASVTWPENRRVDAVTLLPFETQNITQR
jgi:hypothetical protein